MNAGPINASLILRAARPLLLNAIVRHLVPLKHSLCYVSCYAKRELLSNSFKWIVVISLIDRDYDYEKIDDLNVMVMFNVSTFT